jgi:hypothetical protein
MMSARAASVALPALRGKIVDCGADLSDFLMR